LTNSQNADSITASAGAGCSRSSEFGAHDRAKSLLTISEICIVRKKLGLNLVSEKTDNGRIYRIKEGKGSPAPALDQAA
jgi:hypothetical protein